MNKNINIGAYLLVTKVGSSVANFIVEDSMIEAEKIVVLGIATVDIKNSIVKTSWNLCLYERI